MWYVYREYANGEIIEDAYETLQLARNAKSFFEDHFDAELIKMSPLWTISPAGGRLYREPKTAPKSWWSWLAGILKPLFGNRMLSR